MKIDNYRLDMTVEHSRVVKNSLQLDVESSANNTDNQQGIRPSSPLLFEDSQLTYTAREMAANRNQQLSSSTITNEDSEKIVLSHESDIQSLVSDFVGQNVSLTSLRVNSEPLSENTNNQSLSVNQNSVQSSELQEAVALQIGQFSVLSQFIEHEQEMMSFQAQGEVTLADGRSIHFDLALSMEREYFKQEQLSISSATNPLVYDPLVLDLAGNGPEFSQVKFDFDIDNNGETENLAFIGPGSGFLVFDKNQDGAINNGSEMFGGVTGKGFKELAVHDDDGNMWIDENDAIFEKLQIWHLNDNGEKQLTSLKDAGVGAIYLGSENNNYTLKDQHNNALGTIQKSGVYLKENGEVSSISQFDLAQQDDLNLGLKSKLDDVAFDNRVINQTQTLASFTSWFESDNALEDIDQLIEKIENQEFSLTQFTDAQIPTDKQKSSYPLLDFLQSQINTSQNNFQQYAEQYENQESAIIMKFSHLSRLVNMLSALQEDE